MTRVPGNGCQEALADYTQVADDLHAGRTPRPDTTTLTVADLCNHFLTAEKHKQEAGEIGARTVAEYRGTTDRRVATFGNGRRFRATASRLGPPVRPHAIGDTVQKVRTVFKFGAENGCWTGRPSSAGSSRGRPARRSRGRLRVRQLGRGQPAAGRFGPGRRLGDVHLTQDRRQAAGRAVAGDRRRSARGPGRPAGPKAAGRRGRCSALVRRLEREGKYEGTASNVLARLAVGQDTRRAGWPGNGRALVAVPGRFAPSLRPAGRWSDGSRGTTSCGWSAGRPTPRRCPRRPHTRPPSSPD